MKQLQIRRGVSALAVPLPRPYPHPSYGRWSVDIEVIFSRKKRKEKFRRLAKIGLWVPNEEFRRRIYWLESFAEMLEMPYTPSSVELGHELPPTPYGHIYSLRHCSIHGGVAVSIYPPDSACWVVALSNSSIMAEVQFHSDLKDYWFSK